MSTRISSQLQRYWEAEVGRLLLSEYNTSHGLDFVIDEKYLWRRRDEEFPDVYFCSRIDEKVKVEVEVAFVTNQRYLDIKEPLHRIEVAICKYLEEKPASGHFYLLLKNFPDVKQHSEKLRDVTKSIIGPQLRQHSRDLSFTLDSRQVGVISGLTEFCEKYISHAGGILNANETVYGCFIALDAEFAPPKEEYLNEIIGKKLKKYGPKPEIILALAELGCRLNLEQQDVDRFARALSHHKDKFKEVWFIAWQQGNRAFRIL